VRASRGISRANPTGRRRAGPDSQRPVARACAADERPDRLRSPRYARELTIVNRYDIPLPRIEGAQSEIVVAAWLKQPGDSVRAGEIVAEVSTDKVNVEIASPVTGVLEAILAGEGATVVEGAPLARVVLLSPS
jgi:biotin carboxyl carrier protein